MRFFSRPLDSSLSPNGRGRKDASNGLGQGAGSDVGTAVGSSVLGSDANVMVGAGSGGPQPLGMSGGTSAVPASAVPALVAASASNGSQLALDANGASALYGVSGAGVKIGIISDSFDTQGAAAADEADGALPSANNINVLKDSASGTDEGRAMAQVIHSIAPDAQIDFYSGVYGQQSFGTGIAAMQADGCQIIVDDLSYLSEPFYQMGDPIEQEIRSFVTGGGTYFTAATNPGPQSFYEDSWRPLRTVLPGIGPVTAMNFGTSRAPNSMESVDLRAGLNTSFNLQWAQPWQSIDGAGSAYSLGFAIYDPSGNLVSHFFRNVQNGDPIQIGAIDPTVSGTYSIAIYANAGTDPGDPFKIIGSNDSFTPVSFANSSGSGSIYGHSMDPYAITVGADYYGNSAAFGNTPQSEPFSAAGPGELLLGPEGRTLASPIQLHKVNVTGPDGQTTTDPQVSPFFGTSAAAPAVAALAGLMLQANPSLTPAQIRADLEGSATSFGVPEQTGAGLAQAQSAVALAQGGYTSGLAANPQGGSSTLLWQNGNVSPSVLGASASRPPSTGDLKLNADPAGNLLAGEGGSGGVLWTGASSSPGAPSTESGVSHSRGLSAAGGPKTAMLAGAIGLGSGDILYHDPGRSLSATSSSTLTASVPVPPTPFRLHART